MTKLLALGTVVRTRIAEGMTMRLVVAGYFPRDEKTGKLFDYAAVAYPSGMQLKPTIFTFNQSDIIALEHPGYQDEEGEDLTTRLPELLKEYMERCREVLGEEHP